MLGGVITLRTWHHAVEIECLLSVRNCAIYILPLLLNYNYDNNIVVSCCHIVVSYCGVVLSYCGVILWCHIVVSYCHMQYKFQFVVV